ncbi:MAG TPA: hypothetical protein VFY71_09935 [Planctomycetota bacterium]|nr:hypothetical protein [Planctomycetota bacterium]
MAPWLPTPDLPAPVEASVPATGAAAEPVDDPESKVHGAISARYVGRTSGGDHDQDAYVLLQTSVNDADTDPWNAYVSGRVAQDLDGDTSDGASPYHSLADTHGSSTTTKLYEAWVEARPTGFDMVRVGRQEMWDTPAWIRFDGLLAQTAPEGDWKQQLGFYGGQPAPLESTGSGDSVWGAWLKDRPWDGGRTRLDVMNLKDDELDADSDTLLSADVRQQLGTEVGLEGTYTWLEGSPLDLDLRATWARVEDGWTGEVVYHELLNEQNVHATQIDTFSTALLTYEPYWQVGAILAKSFAHDLDLSGGWDMRRLKDAADEGDFNREYDRGWLTGVVHDVLIKGCSVTLTGERWEGDGSELDTWGMDVTQEWTQDVSGSVGSYYTMYKDDFVQGQQDQDVRTWYAKLRLRSDPRLTWTFLFDHEDNSIATYDTLTVRAAWTF